MKLIRLLPRRAADRRAGTLAAAAGELETACRPTERDFLSVGGKLEEIACRAREAAEALAAMRDEPQGEPGHGLAAALDDAVNWARQAGGGAASGDLVASLVQGLRALCAPLRDLNSSVRALRVLAVATRVESARLGAEAAGFEALAAEVAELAGAVGEKAGAILEAAAGLRGALEEARGSAARLESEQRADLAVLLQGCAALLDGLRAERDRVAAAAEGARQEYRRVADGIAGLVVALQVHDNARQRIEHVRAGLERAAEDLRKGADSGQVEGLIGLQAAQLSETRQVFVSAVDKIKADLAGLEGSVAGLAREACALAAASEGDGHAWESRVAAVEAAMENWAASRRSLAAVAENVSRSCGWMTGFVAEIESVGDRMLRLALNAEIQAVRLADSGAVMEAVAEGIRTVSREASASAGGAGAALREVGGSVGLIEAAFGGGRDGGIRELGARIRSAGAELTADGAGRRRLLESAGESGGTLAGEMASLRDGIAAGAVMSAAVSACLKVLDETCAALRAGSRRPAAGERPGLAGLKDDRDHYTMRAERELHDAFTRAAPVEEIQAPPPDAGDFGNNVELF